MRFENKSTVIFSFLAMLLIAAPVEGQRPGGGRGSGRGPDREQLEQRIRAQMGRMLQQRLGLEETQAEELSQVVRGFENQRQELARSEEAARRRLVESLARQREIERLPAVMMGEERARAVAAEKAAEEEEAVQ